MPARHVLLVGLEPQAVDVTDPDLPPGMTAETIAAGLAEAQRAFAEQGDRLDLCLFRPAASAEAAIAAGLGRRAYDCVVVGGGIRKPEANLALFERVVNAVRRHAPATPLAFNRQPTDSTEAVRRVLGA